MRAEAASLRCRQRPLPRPLPPRRLLPSQRPRQPSQRPLRRRRLQQRSRQRLRRRLRQRPRPPQHRRRPLIRLHPKQRRHRRRPPIRPHQRPPIHQRRSPPILRSPRAESVPPVAPEAALATDDVVARETSTITRKPSGAVMAAGWDRMAPSQPPGRTPIMVSSTEMVARLPPVSIPAAAPRRDRPRHQMPSTSNGHSDDAATPS